MIVWLIVSLMTSTLWGGTPISPTGFFSPANTNLSDQENESLPVRKLATALSKYRKQSRDGGWALIPNGPPLKNGDSGPRVTALKKRLLAEEHSLLKPGPLFDNRLEQALKRAQKRYGLLPSGVLDAETLKALNIPIESRIHQMEINLERCRRLPADLNANHVLVNIADFKLMLIEQDEKTWETKVVVGKPYRETPVFSSEIRSVVLNPSWRVPQTVAIELLLPIAKKNPRYFADNKFVIFDGHDDDSPIIDPMMVDWGNVTEKNFHYRFFQLPGPTNALGHVKFVFPNEYGVYLHDTPAQDLFMKTVRAFSAGCVRVENPLNLTVYLLKDQPHWTRETLEKAIHEGTVLQIPLAKPFPIHVVYLTSWVDLDGQLQFRNDVYGRDR